MSKSAQKERVLNYVPKEDVIGVPGKLVEGANHSEPGELIAKGDFSLEHLDRLVARAKNRGVNVHDFLSQAGLVHVKGTPELFFEEQTDDEVNPDVINPEAKTEVPEGDPSEKWTAKQLTAYLESKGESVAAGQTKAKLLEAIADLD